MVVNAFDLDRGLLLHRKGELVTPSVAFARGDGKSTGVPVIPNHHRTLLVSPTIAPQFPFVPGLFPTPFESLRELDFVSQVRLVLPSLCFLSGAVP